MNYQAINFEDLLGMPGFSDALLKDHYKLYEGYVENTNKLLSLIKKQEMNSPEFFELKRRLGWEFNGMRLHEYYFGNLSKNKSEYNKKSPLALKIAKDYESFEAWKKEFTAMGLMRGIGWVMLTYDCIAERLHNIWINEHDTGLLVGTLPLLVMDVFEHAYVKDYGIKRDGYIQAFWNDIHWEEVENRYEAKQNALNLLGHSLK